MVTDLIESLKKHDDNAVLLLKDEYLPLILYILKPFDLNNQDQEECIQDVVIKVLDSIELFDSQKMSLKNYIALITRRTGLNYIRKNKNNFSIYEDMDLFGEKDLYESIPWNQIINKLSRKEQVLFYRKYYYFQSIEMISLELGMTYKSVESAIYRLRKKLQKLIREAGYHD